MTDEQMDVRLRRAGEAWRAGAGAPGAATAVGEPVDVRPSAAPHRTHRGALLASAAVLVAALVAGGVWVFVDNRGSNDATQSSASNLSTLLGATWTESASETSAVGGPADSDGPYPTTTELRFVDAEHVTVTHRCYAESGHVTISGDTLNVTDLVRNRTIKCAAVAGTDAANERWSSRVLDDLLSGRPRWSIKDGKLTISDKTTTVTFDSTPSPAPRVDSAPEILTGTWKLATIETASAHDASGRSPAYPVSVSYAGAGQVAVREECGEATLPVILDRSTISFGAPTKRVVHGCIAVGADYNLESAGVGRVVSGTAHWSISEGELTLSKGNTRLTFTR